MEQKIVKTSANIVYNFVYNMSEDPLVSLMPDDDADAEWLKSMAAAFGCLIRVYKELPRYPGEGFLDDQCHCLCDPTIGVEAETEENMEEGVESSTNEDSEQDCDEETSDDMGSDEIPSRVVGVQDDHDKGSLYEQRDDCDEAEAEEHNEEMSAYSPKEVPELDTICSENEGLYEVQCDEDNRKIEEDPGEACDDMAHGSLEDRGDFSASKNRYKKFSNNFESFKEWFAKVNKHFKELKRDYEDEHENDLDNEHEKFVDHERIKFRESTDTQEDGLMSTSWPMRHSLSHEEIEVPIKRLAAGSPNPSRARVRKSYAEVLELSEATDHEKIMTIKDSVERTELSRASESAWVRRESPLCIKSPRGCCGPGASFRRGGRTVTGTSEVMTIKPDIENKSKGHERIKFSVFLNTMVDSLASTREWLVRHAHSQEEIFLPNMPMSRIMSTEIYNIYTNNLISSLMSVRRRGGDRQ